MSHLTANTMIGNEVAPVTESNEFSFFEDEELFIKIDDCQLSRFGTCAFLTTLMYIVHTNLR